MKRKIYLNLGAIIVIALFLSGCEKSIPGDDNTGPYNFDAVLHPVDMKGLGKFSEGLLKFRQNPDTARIITLDTYIVGLLPNHDYKLQRAVNPITDADCTSTAWLTLGLGLVPQAIHTDGQGNGHEKLFRDVTSAARGTQFKIHFQIIDAVSLASVLTSDCESYTVR